MGLDNGLDFLLDFIVQGFDVGEVKCLEGSSEAVAGFQKASITGLEVKVKPSAFFEFFRNVGRERYFGFKEAGR